MEREERKMENRMTKEEVIQATINLLNSISVPVWLSEQITQPITGAVQNLAIALEMCRADSKANERATEAPAEEAENAERAGGLFEVPPEDNDLYGDGEDKAEEMKADDDSEW